MRLAVYGAVLVIALGGVLLGLDRIPAPMSPMVDTAAGLAAKPAPALPAPTVQASPSMPATIGAPIVPQTLAAPASPAPVNPAPVSPAAPATAGASMQAAAPLAASEPEVRCNVDACTAAYRSFRPADCTYQPSNGPRRLCTK
jgi:hypothetical protein